MDCLTKISSKDKINCYELTTQTCTGGILHLVVQKFACSKVKVICKGYKNVVNYLIDNDIGPNMFLLSVSKSFYRSDIIKLDLNAFYCNNIPQEKMKRRYSYNNAIQP